VIVKRAIQRYSAPDLVKGAYKRLAGLSTSEFRLLPDFIIIGAQRCGTTSMYNYLSQHPDVYPSYPKEVHFFTNYYRKGLSWYRSHFPLALYKRFVITIQKGNFVTGEATPYYLSHPHAPRRISAALPDVRLIILLRNPVDRAFSHYRSEVKMGIEALSFEEAIRREAERLSKEKEKMVQDEYYLSFNHQHYSYLLRGIYIDQLISWERCFERVQLLIVRSEDFYREPGETLKRVQTFIGLRTFELKGYKQYNTAPYTALKPATRERLVSYFKPHNERLYEYLGLNLGWEG
jgi:hypothetical protein